MLNCLTKYVWRNHVISGKTSIASQVLEVISDKVADNMNEYDDENNKRNCDGDITSKNQ